MTLARRLSRSPRPRRSGPLGACAVLLACVAPALARQTTAPEADLELALEDALRIALESNIGLDVQRLATEELRQLALGSWGAFDPVLFLQGTLTDRESPGVSDLSGANVLEEDTQSGIARLTWPVQTGGTLQLQLSHDNSRTNNSFAVFDVSTTDVFTASLVQPLLRGAWVRYATSGQREAEANYELQRERERQTLQRLLLDVSNAYWDLVSAREELAVRELAVTLGREQQTRDERRLAVGTGTEVDVLQARTNVAQQEEARIRARQTLRTAEDNLRRLLLQKPTGETEGTLDAWDRPIVPITPLPEVQPGEEPRDLDWREALERALRGRPELAQERALIDVAEIRLQRSRSERLPQLDLTLAATGVGFDTDPQDAFSSSTSFEFPEYRAGLTFSVPLGNRQASHAARAARAALRRSRLSYDQRELDVLAEVRAALRDVRFRAEAVQAATTSLELARRQLEAEQSRLDIGLSTTFQVLEFQQDLAQALSTERAARAAYAKAWAALAHAEGTLGTEGGAPPADG